MSEQPSIFDESFEDKIQIRRRSLIPVALKIYMVALTLYGVYQIFGRCYFLYQYITYYMKIELDAGVNTVGLYTTFFRGLFSSFVLIAMPVLLWCEWKWAIRFCWAALAYSVLVIISDYILGNGYGVYMGIIALVMTPYYSILFQIQKKWEQ